MLNQPSRSPSRSSIKGYDFAAFSEANDFASVFPLPHVGFVMTGGCFLLITILRIIPRLNRERTGDS